MADYFSLLSRAVANLPPSSPATARRAIYERARKALVAQLRSLKPQLPESDIAREENALEEAVARLEAEFQSRQAGPSAIVKPQMPPPASGPARSPPTLAGATARPASPPPPPPPPARAAPPPPIAPPRRSAALAGAAPFAAQADAGRAVASAAAPSPRDFVADPPAARPGFIRKTTGEAAGAPLVASNAAAAIGPDHAPRIGSPLEPAAIEPPSARGEIEPPRPSAPSASEPRRANPWPWVVLAVAGGLVASIAVAAFLLREKPQDLTIKEPAETAAPAPNGPKIAERVGAAPAPAAPQTPEPEAATSAAPPAPAATPTPLASPLPEPPPAKAAGATGATGASQAAAAPARAAMLVATSGDPQKPAVDLGSVVWSAAPANPGQPGSSGVKADVEVPDLKMHATMILRKNVDASLPASHTIDLRVTFDEGSSVKGIKDIGLPQMRRDDPPTTSPLAGVHVKINDSYFLIGLNRADADIARNIEAIGSLGWFDFPMLLSDDRIAKLTFEKAADGEKIVNDAIAGWK